MECAARTHIVHELRHAILLPQLQPRSVQRGRTPPRRDIRRDDVKTTHVRLPQRSVSGQCVGKIATSGRAMAKSRTARSDNTRASMSS